MFEFLALDGSIIWGAALIAMVLAFLRFGNALVDHLLLYRSSAVETVENSFPDQD